MSRNVVLLQSHPVGEPKESDYKVTTESLGELEDGKIRVKSLLFSVDPYLRGKMSGKRDAYFIPFELNGPISSLSVAKVVESKHKDYAVGDRVIGDFPWADINDLSIEGSVFSARKISPDLKSESALAIGLTGLTAYIGLLVVGKLESLKPGSTVVVSAAAGATGNVVGQLAKIKGYRVVGTAGTDEKVDWLKNELHFDEAINYSKVSSLEEALKAACPDGVDLYFDNVGGETFDILLRLMNRKGVVVNCGAISNYNAVEPPVGPRVEWFLISKSLRMQGFIFTDYAEHFGTGTKEMTQWIQEGKLVERINPIKSLGDVSGIYKGFITMLSGGTIGKSLVYLADE